MNDVFETLLARNKTHGNFKLNAECSQALKDVIRANGVISRASIMDEALDMISSKISRIVTGNPYEPDHWQDIAGYATLIVIWLKGAEITDKDTSKDTAK
jgi:hypothetical protein